MYHVGDLLLIPSLSVDDLLLVYVKGVMLVAGDEGGCLATEGCC